MTAVTLEESCPLLALLEIQDIPEVELLVLLYSDVLFLRLTGETDFQMDLETHNEFLCFLLVTSDTYFKLQCFLHLTIGL